MKEFWNERFAREEFIYGTKPNFFFKSEFDKINKKGKALFPLEGEGRNACYAAKFGWNVEAFDFSLAAKEKAIRLCDSYSVPITYEISKAEDFDFQKETYDLVVLIYAHVNPKLRKDFHHNVMKSLKLGGRIILEAFHPKQLKNAYTSGGPKSPEMLYSLDELKMDFEGLSELKGKELEIELNEGEYHRGKGFVTRLTGVK